MSAHLDPAEVGRRLQSALADALGSDGQEVPPERVLRRALNVVLVQFPTLLSDAMRRAMAACAEVVDASELPEAWGSAEPLPDSLRNLYGVMPAGSNRREARFADQLDTWPGALWWTRNPARPNAADDWSVRIVLPGETGRGYYPDFLVCVDGLAEARRPVAGRDEGAHRIRG